MKYWKASIGGQSNKQNIDAFLISILQAAHLENIIHITEYQSSKPRSGLQNAQQLLLKAKADSILALRIMEEIELET